MRTNYPLPTQGADASSTTDYEQLTYETLANGTRSSNLVLARRNRAGETANYGFDALGRTILKDLPGTEPDVTYGYDLLGRLTSASQTGHALSFTYDALGRRLTETGPMGIVGSTWDLAGRRTRITHPGGTYYVDQDYLVTGEISAIRENGATSGLGVIAAFAYDSRGRRISLTRGNGAVTTYAYDNASRLSQLVQNPAGTASDLSVTFGYNPASQIVSNTRSNDAYTFAPAAGATASTVNGLNQLSLHGGASVTHDARGNITSEGGRTFGYSSENLLTGVSASGWSQTYGYDPLLRFAATTGAGLPRSYAYDGDDMLVTNLNGQFLTRIVHGPGENEPLYQLDNQGRRYWYHADERGSIVAASDTTGAVVSIVPFDEYGNSTGSPWVYGYAGAFWLPVTRQYYMRARVYDPALGRFLQADPIGYGDGMNLYSYVRGDPVNRSDPTGSISRAAFQVNARRLDFPGELRGNLSRFSLLIQYNDLPPVEEEGPPIEVTGQRCRGTWIGDNCVLDLDYYLGRNFYTCSWVIAPGNPGACSSTRLPPPPRPPEDQCGSGTRSWPPEGLSGADFRAACARHDDCYGTLGASKLTCDRQLGTDIYNACMRVHHISTMCGAVSATYFAGVAGWGQGPFDEAQALARENQ